jgi:hypothetical protein
MDHYSLINLYHKVFVILPALGNLSYSSAPTGSRQSRDLRTVERINTQECKQEQNDSAFEPTADSQGEGNQEGAEATGD